ncbi:MAG: hypothetical protein KBT66_06425 [Amphritea sp.]|nr:hypothetical protein [Amphritea sp.]
MNSYLCIPRVFGKITKENSDLFEKTDSSGLHWLCLQIATIDNTQELNEYAWITECTRRWNLLLIAIGHDPIKQFSSLSCEHNELLTHIEPITCRGRKKLVESLNQCNINQPLILAQQVLQEVEHKGQKKVCSGELRLAGRNYALDILAAVNFTRETLCEKREYTDLQSIIQLLEKRTDAFSDTHYDPECFGIGTLRDIINQLESLQDEY